MEIGKKIQQLLQHHADVYISGLGVFTRVHKPSVFDEKHDVFLPPVNYIEFDASRQDGFNIADYIQQESGISHQEAEEIIERLVKSIELDLKEKGHVFLEQLGHLVPYGNGIVFKALDLSGFNFSIVENVKIVDDQFLNTSVESDRSDIKDQKEESSEEVDEEHVLSSESDDQGSDFEEEEIENDTPAVDQVSSSDEITDGQIQEVISEESTEQIVGVNQQDETSDQSEQLSEEKSVEDQSAQSNEVSANASEDVENEQEITYIEENESKSNSNTFWYILVAVVGLGIIGTLWYINSPIQFGKEAQKKLDADTIVNSSNITTEQAQDTTNRLTDSTSLINQKLDDSLSSAVQHHISEADSVEVIPVHHVWQVIIGSHKSLAQANDQVASNHKKGHNSVRVRPKRKGSQYYHVIWNTYETKAEADSVTANLLRNHATEAYPNKIK